MEVLDGDVVRLSSRGREAERDIVQVSASFRLLVKVRIIYVVVWHFCVNNLQWLRD